MAVVASRETSDDCNGKPIVQVVVHKVVAGTEIAMEMYEQVKCFCERRQHRMVEQEPGRETAP